MLLLLAGCCGSDADARLALYRRGADGPFEVSTLTAADRCGAVAALLVPAPGVPERAGAYLPLDDVTRAALHGLEPVHCGW